MRTIHIESLGLQTIDENGNRSPMVEFMLSVLGAISKDETEIPDSMGKKWLESC